MSCCLKDKVCMILDLEGFFVDKTFCCRELGYYTWQEDFGRHAFFRKTRWNDLHFRERKTVSYVKYNVHGLTYQPRREEYGREYYLLEDVICDLYSKAKTKDRTVVAYKGGHVEQDLLLKLNIPHVDLEHYGCPKYDTLKETIVEPLPSCGFHIDDSIHHCPMTECHAFWLWLNTYAM